LFFTSYEVSVKAVNPIIERQEFDSTRCDAGSVGFAGSNPNTYSHSFNRVNHTNRACSNCFDHPDNRVNPSF
jgi:hypothetical protein